MVEENIRQIPQIPPRHPGLGYLMGMFSFLAFVCLVMMTGLYSQGSFILGSLALASAFGFGYLADRAEAAEEWAIGTMFGIGAIAMFVWLIYGAWSILTG